MKKAKSIKEIKEEIGAYKQLSDCLECRISYCGESVFDFFETIRCSLYMKLQELIYELEYIFEEKEIEKLKEEIDYESKGEKNPFMLTFIECTVIYNFINKKGK